MLVVTLAALTALNVVVAVLLALMFCNGVILPIAPVNVTLPAPAFINKLSVFAVVPLRVLLKVRLPLLVVPDVVRVIVG